MIRPRWTFGGHASAMTFARARARVTRTRHRVSVNALPGAGRVTRQIQYVVTTTTEKP